MGCANTKLRKMRVKIQELESANEELLVEVEALKATAIADASGPQGQIYQRVAARVVFKGNSPLDMKQFGKKLPKKRIT